ncbi:MAG: DUF1844 domain-containing protein [Planctomycetota bacterium]
MSDEEPKIIVDSDWKEQVQKEKDLETGKDDAPLPTDSQATSSEDAAADADPTSVPEASFTVLVSMLFSQAMTLLGQIPGPDGQSEVNKPFAKHTIDTLEVLESKTSGNLDEEESKVLSEALHVLRMAFVNAKG